MVLLSEKSNHVGFKSWFLMQIVLATCL